MGVLRSSSCFITPAIPGMGLRRISDGKVADLGVCNGGRTGLVVAGMVGSEEERPSLLNGGQQW